MSTARFEELLDDLLAGNPLPVATDDEPRWLSKLRRWVADREQTELRLSASRAALDHLTATLMRVAALDFDDLPIAPVTGDDVIDAAHLGLSMMAEELAASQHALKSARDEAVEANQVKSSFLASVSHELRTPLNAIIGYSELATEDLEGLGANLALEDLERVLLAAHHLLGLISDVLDLSKIEAGRFALAMQPVDVSPLVREVCEAVRHQAESNGNQIRIELGDAPRLWGDPTRLRQVLFNLIGNAAKYTRNGRIDVLAGLDGPDGWIEVRDTGIGISKDHLRRIFQPFFRVDEHGTAPGTGLGLAISEQLCLMMNGTIEVTSELTAGSTFRVRLATQPRSTLELACPSP